MDLQVSAALQLLGIPLPSGAAQAQGARK
jgi:hypothetical protein